MSHDPDADVCFSLLVAVPKIAQAKIDDAELILNRITVSNAQSNTMTMDIDSTIKTDGSVHANIDGFPGVMYLEDHPDQTPFARIDFPPTTAAKHQSVKVNQLIEIDAPALTIFNKWLVANESLRVTVLGETHVKVKGLTKSYPVTFKKTITMPGRPHALTPSSPHRVESAADMLLQAWTCYTAPWSTRLESILRRMPVATTSSAKPTFPTAPFSLLSL